MITALEEMEAAAKSFQAACSTSGVLAKSKQYDNLGKAIQQGWTSSLELAVDQLNPVGGKVVKIGVEVGKAAAKDYAADLAKEDAKQ